MPKSIRAIIKSDEQMGDSRPLNHHLPAHYMTNSNETAIWYIDQVAQVPLDLTDILPN